MDCTEVDIVFWYNTTTTTTIELLDVQQHHHLIGSMTSLTSEIVGIAATVSLILVVYIWHKEEIEASEGTKQ